MSMIEKKREGQREGQQGSYEKIQKSMEEAFKKIKDCKGKDLVLVVGITGAGKSTTVNYLMRYPMKRVRGKAVPIDPSSPLPPAEMGSSAQPITTYPATYSSQEGVVYCDCPGFEDSRDSETRVCVSLSTEAVVKEAKSVKAVLVVVEWGSIDAGRGKAFKDLALTLSNLFNQSKSSSFDIQKSILFLITKIPTDQDIDKDYCIERIDEQLKTQQKRLKEEQAKQQASEGWSSLGAFGSAVGASVSNSLRGRGSIVGTTFSAPRDSKEKEKENLQIFSDLQKMVSMLTLMRSNSDNIILVDVFDKGQTRGLINKHLKGLTPVPKETINFHASDPVRRHFCEQVMSSMLEAISKMLRVKNLPAEIEAIMLQESAALEKEKQHQAQIADIDSGREFKGAYDPIVLANKETIEQNEKEIKVHKVELQSIEDRVEELKRDLYALDSSEPTRFYEDSFKQRRQDELSSAIVSPGAGTMKAVEPENFVSGGIAFTVATALTVGFSPLTGLYGIMRRIDHDFEYEGAPFLRVDETVPSGELKRVCYEPTAGKYEAHYESDRGSTGKASIVIWGEKRNKPENSAKITQLKEEMQLLRAKKAGTEERIGMLVETNRKLAQTNDDFIRGDQQKREDTRKNVEGLIADSKACIVSVRKQLVEKQEKLISLKKDVEGQKALYTVIGKLASFINFKTELYPALSEEFLQLSKEMLAIKIASEIEGIPREEKSRLPFKSQEGSSSASTGVLFGGGSGRSTSEASVSSPIRPISPTPPALPKRPPLSASTRVILGGGSGRSASESPVSSPIKPSSPTLSVQTSSSVLSSSLASMSLRDSSREDSSARPSSSTPVQRTSGLAPKSSPEPEFGDDDRDGKKAPKEQEKLPVDKEEKGHRQSSPDADLFPASETMTKLQQKLQQLCEENYTFTIKRTRADQLVLQFTAADSVLAEEKDIKTELIAVTKLLQRSLTEAGIACKPNQFRPNWSLWMLTIQADSATLNQIARLLQTAGFAHLPTAARGPGFFQMPVSAGVPSTTSLPGHNDDVSETQCGIQ